MDGGIVSTTVGLRLKMKHYSCQCNQARLVILSPAHQPKAIILKQYNKTFFGNNCTVVVCFPQADMFTES